MPREAIVLAGGFGTRLQKVVSDVPKPMAPVAGKPFLEHVMHYLNEQHITHVVLAVGYLHETIIAHFGDQFKNISITYSIEKDPLGTGGGIMQACNYLQGDETFIINGDTFFDISLGELHHFHASKNAALTIALKKMVQFERYGTVEIDANGMVTGFHEKKYLDEGLINAGVYCLKTSLFHPSLPAAFSFEKEILEKQFVHQSVYAIAFDGYFIDIGIPEDYERSQTDFAAR